MVASFRRARRAASRSTFDAPARPSCCSTCSPRCSSCSASRRTRREDDPLAAAVGIGDRRPRRRTTRPWPGCSPTATPTTRRRRPSSAATPSRTCASGKRRTRTALAMLGHPGGCGRPSRSTRAGRGLAARAQRPAAGARHPAGGHRGLRRAARERCADDDPRLPLCWVYDWPDATSGVPGPGALVSGSARPAIGSGRVLAIDQATYDAIVAHARRDHPDEACGVVAGPAGSDRPSGSSRC